MKTNSKYKIPNPKQIQISKFKCSKPLVLDFGHLDFEIV
jgi:hypothetical protein